MSKKLISIITPVLNESESINNFYTQMKAVTDQLSQYDFEFIFTDNASKDNTFNLLQALALKDNRIKVYRFSRNFGYQASILTGYQKSKGNAVIEYDCDLQDPPELLPEFIDQWEKGNKIVYGLRASRKENFFITLLRKLFYRLIRAIGQVDLPVDSGDFMMLDRVVVDLLANTNEKNLYLRGMVFSYGFKSCGIKYHRQARVTGKTKFNLTKMLRLAFDGIVSQSVLPLRVASYFALFICFVSMTLSLFYIYLKIFSNYTLPDGFTTLSLLTLFGITLNAFFLGIIGEYLIRIYHQVRNNPHVIITDKIEN